MEWVVGVGFPSLFLDIVRRVCGVLLLAWGMSPTVGALVVVVARGVGFLVGEGSRVHF